MFFHSNHSPNCFNHTDVLSETNQINHSLEAINCYPKKIKKINLPNTKTQKITAMMINPIKHNHEKQTKRQHVYDDYAPISASIYDYKPVYIPKTLSYIYSSRILDRDHAMIVKGKIQDYLNLDNHQRAQAMQKMMQVRPVLPEDTKDRKCDPELIGNQGVFAKYNIPKNTVIGIYVGIFIQNSEELRTLAKKISYEHVQDYLFRVGIDQVFPKVSAYQHGNRLSMINSATNSFGNSNEADTVSEQRRNINIVMAQTKECPKERIEGDNMDVPDLIFFISDKNIPANQQLLYDYGNKYWS